MHRFFVPPEWLHGERVLLTGPISHQLTRVLRMRPGDHVVLLDNSGWAYEVELEALTSEQVVAHVVATSQPETEPRVRAVLYQALPKAKKFELALQKGTELGISAFVPLITRHCLWKGPDRVDDRKMARWQRIVTEAAEQSGRARLPQVLPATPLAEVCQAPIPADVLALMACAGSEARPLGDVLDSLGSPAPREVHLLVGPEGGFAPSEVELARQAGIVSVSLGPRVLRTETAGLVGFSIILYALGELG